MAQQRTDILFPVGRMVMGNLYEPRTQDAEGKPLVVKNGPGAGKARVEYFVAVAIPKGTERAWWETPWGQQIKAAGAAAFPQAYASPAFAWKVDDGDSAVPNKKGRKPCDNEGWKGHWVVRFSGGYAPKIVTADGSQQITEKGAVKNGYFIQVFGNVSGNGSVSQPGVFLDHSGIALAAYGEEIKSGPDLAAVGFGQGALPAGASATPLGGGFNPAPAAAGMPMMPGVPAPAAGMPMMPGVPAAAPTVVAPNAAFLVGPGGAPAAQAAMGAAMQMPPALQMPGVPAAPAAPMMTPKGVATGFSYEQYRTQGYSDELLRQHGLIV